MTSEECVYLCNGNSNNYGMCKGAVRQIDQKRKSFAFACHCTFYVLIISHLWVCVYLILNLSRFGSKSSLVTYEPEFQPRRFGDSWRKRKKNIGVLGNLYKKKTKTNKTAFQFTLRRGFFTPKIWLVPPKMMRLPIC